MLKIEKIEVTQEERQVLLLLEEKGNCLYGNIFKELKIAHTKGAKIISYLMNKGYIKNVGWSSYYELAINL
jgi:hypothetical protein